MSYIGIDMVVRFRVGLHEEMSPTRMIRAAVVPTCLSRGMVLSGGSDRPFDFRVDEVRYDVDSGVGGLSAIHREAVLCADDIGSHIERWTAAGFAAVLGDPE